MPKELGAKVVDVNFAQAVQMSQLGF